ncbi:MAG: acyltransferase [Ferruginibacter sp.]|nr:acyltransferase [Ferruginibacter sp.]
MNSKPAVRFDALTGFRCLAACLVFFYHNRKYWRDFLHPEILRLFNEFHIGVSLFFVLSGFLIAYTYAEEPLKSAKSYAKYFSVRFVRIMPLYWLILTAYYLDPAFGNMHFSWLTYLLFHGFSDQHNLDAIAQAWSLNIEMTFYALAPLLCLLQKKHLVYLLGFLALLFLGTWAIGYYWHQVNGNPHKWLYPLHFVLSGTFPGRCLEFVVGMMLANYIRSNKTEFIQKFRFKTIIGFAGIFISTYCIGLFQSKTSSHGSDQPEGMTLQLLALPVFVAIALAGLIYEKSWLQKFFSSRVMVLLGNASFAFYLIHISYVNLKVREWFLLPDRNFVVLWLISIILYLVFEKPIYDGYRKRIKKPAKT